MSKYARLFTDENTDKQAEPEGSKYKPYTLLFVDDEVGVLQALKRVFFEENYEILTAQNGLQGLEVLEKYPEVNLVISDFKMPEMNGADFLRKVKDLYPEIIRIMLTGHADVAAVMGAVNEGAVYKFITKPWNDDDLRITVSLALEQYDLIKKNRELKSREKEYRQEINNLSKFATLNRSRLGPMLIKSKLISQEQTIKCEKLQRQRNCSMPKLLMELGYVKESDIIRLVKKNLGIEYIYLSEFPIDKHTIQMIPHSVCEKSIIMPVKLEGKKMTIAMADPTDYSQVDDLRFATGFDISVVMASEKDIRMKLEECYGVESYLEDAMGALDELEPFESIDIVLEEEEERLEDLLLAKDIPPAIRIVNAIISEAIRLRASDIHIEPKVKFASVRFRIDDMLHEKIQIPLNYYIPTVSRLKIMSDMDIADRRKPQDGRVTVKTADRIVDLRVASLPTINGEKIVIRILDRNAQILEITDLGISSNQKKILKMIIAKPQGIILATGPTGSGKTTTLYSLLMEIATSTKNFITIENPVEYLMESAGQVHVRDKIGLDFAFVLRSVLRQDPNVIMVGEIRDMETAQVAFQAALTGHLVLSTLHTNNSIATISRLIHQGLKPYIIASALEGIISQRLLRKLCNKCKEKYDPPDEMLSYLGIEKQRNEITFYRGRGCEFCNSTGYSGRTGIYEILVVNDELKELITGNAPENELKMAARKNGMTTLYEEGIVKIKSGETTCDEVLRVLGPKPHAGMSCPKCGKEIDQKLVWCPFCGNTSDSVCLKCKGRLEPDWRICPFCGVPKK